MDNSLVLMISIQRQDKWLKERGVEDFENDNKEYKQRDLFG